MLSLASVPQPRSLRFQAPAVSLANRALSCYMMKLENAGSPRIMTPDEMYTFAESLVAEFLAFTKLVSEHT